MKKNLLIVFLTLLANSLFAQTYNLQQCIELAITNNIQIKQSEVSKETTAGNYLQSKENYLPSINASASNGYNFGRSVDPFTNLFTTDRIRSNNFAISGNMDLWNGLQNLNNVRRRRAEYMAGHYDLEKLKNDISLSVITAYLQVLFAEDQLNNARNASESSRLQKERAEKLVKAGAAAENVLLDLKAQAATDELTIVNAENTLDIARLNLFQLMEITPANEIKLERPNIIINSESLAGMSPTAIFEQALTTQPQIKSAEQRIQSSKYAYNSSFGALSPRLSLSGNVFTGYSSAQDPIRFYDNNGNQILIPYPFKEQVKNNVSKSLSLQLSIPIFNKMQVQNSVRLSKLGVKNSEYSLQQQKNQLRKTIEQAYLDAKAAARKLVAVQSQNDALETAFTNAEKRFNIGAVNFTDYTVARNNKIRSQADLTQARYDLFFKIKVLEFYQGNTLTF